jgi:hypothetical protein
VTAARATDDGRTHAAAPERIILDMDSSESLSIARSGL